jgi:hypothetical protein
MPTARAGILFGPILIRWMPVYGTTNQRHDSPRTQSNKLCPADSIYQTDCTIMRFSGDLLRGRRTFFALGEMNDDNY